eukprot:GHVN01078953.1.p1 GENE.GHVN01078953.1~~GHVN01078953.1.p1  ORF type:complete len:211 (+),score=7.43 GHVN01078953.1:1016-1648(+)
MSLQWLWSAKQPKLARWGLRLQEYDFKIVPGKANLRADALSRCIAPLVIPTTFPSPDEIRLIQEQDPFCKELGERRPNNHVRKDGIWLYQTQSDGTQICLPANLREVVHQHAHNGELAGHLERTKTLQRVKERFVWPGISNDGAAYVKGCEACAKRKTPKALRQGLLQPIRVAEPFEVVAMDIKGPMPRSKGGNLYAEHMFYRRGQCDRL